VIEPLLALPAHLRSRLGQALASGALSPPYTAPAIRSALGGGGGVDAGAIGAALAKLEASGVGGRAIALALDVAARSAASMSRPDLVWSGPPAPGVHTRSTRQVYEELVGAAERSIWISTYAYYDGHHQFKSLAERMSRVPALEVRLLLNIGRRHGDFASAHELVTRFAERFWRQDWPGERRPDVYYDPRSLDPDGPEGVLHAKAIVVDEQAAFVTSANLTEAAFDRNVEVGILSRDRLLAASLARHFRVLIDHGRLVGLAA
jgi:phosphatidylserine/phosphatidylglycerophosphate/cardiolipin synthase-like enzyme